MSLPLKRLHEQDSLVITAIFTGAYPENALPMPPPSTHTIYFRNLNINQAVKTALRNRTKIIHVFDSQFNCKFKYIAINESQVIRINPKKLFKNFQGHQDSPPEGKTKTLRTVDFFVYEQAKDLVRPIPECNNLWIAVKWKKPTLFQPQPLLNYLFQNEIHWLQQLHSSKYIPSLQGIVTYQSFSELERKIVLLPRYTATLSDYINTPLDPETKCTLRKNVFKSCVVLGENVHRDLSPDNFFVKADLSVVIGDLEGMINPKNVNDLHNLILGTPEYMAPEIASMMLYVRKSRENTTIRWSLYKDLLQPAVDAFSLGRILYEFRIEEDGLPDHLFCLSQYEDTDPEMSQETNILTARVSLNNTDKNYPDFFKTEPSSLSYFGKIVWGLLRPHPRNRLSIKEAITQFELSRGGFVPVG
ncbi:MAG: Protein kinase domain [Chlamydiota bacterium]|jgi:serine/threonine protein kinase